ncbi:hypothetical protein BD410DRAFT_808888 [Rickenella mellea]|uniref:Uncharacterized protein n=1 Tax=Rickenella mellea TaxID=50990 RepID=A0A4Y7PJ22_9AGAM|nr:hypothetical protein BD410DRAFT_808888 [Rickenella mellea]
MILTGTQIMSPSSATVLIYDAILTLPDYVLHLLALILLNEIYTMGYGGAMFKLFVTVQWESFSVDIKLWLRCDAILQDMLSATKLPCPCGHSPSGNGIGELQLFYALARPCAKSPLCNTTYIGNGRVLLLSDGQFEKVPSGMIYYAVLFGVVVSPL